MESIIIRDLVTNELYQLYLTGQRGGEMYAIYPDLYSEESKN